VSIQILLVGYFGCGNLGDDSILIGLSESLVDLDVKFTMLSGAPDETFRLYGMRSVPRLDLKQVHQAIQEADYIVFPGGSIFQDVTSVRSAGYYSSIVKRAKKANKKVFMLGQGVGPIRTYLGRRFTVSAFNLADEIVVRDPGSMTLLKELGVKRPIKLGADMAFLMPQPPDQTSDAAFQVGEMHTIGIAPRPFGRNVKRIQRLFADLAKKIYDANMIPVMIEMDQHEDGPLIYEIGKLLGGKVPDIRHMRTPMNVQQRMSRMEAVIAMRLHAGILAASVGVPPYMISYDPKVTALAKLLELAPAPPIDDLTADRLFENFMAFLKDRERNVRIVERKREEMKSAAMVNVTTLRESLKNAVRS
jgi:polysaccharide pyruvyl transferase CsaB